MPGKENARECKWQLFWTSRWELILPGNTQAWNVPKNMGTERHGGEEEWGGIRQIWENVTPGVSLSLPEVCVLPTMQCVFHGFSENSHHDLLYLTRMAPVHQDKRC